ncbi:type IX secretion system periplasmic lipoprotein PorW/SprE [Chitinophaga cymbidii]|nr:tetratricopeptide repeat protein [Chitinophaga cymbidii]
MNHYRSLLMRAYVVMLIICSGAMAAYGQNQPATPKPAKVEDRRPPSEKMAEKRWTIKRKLVQNTVTRYNYYYHAKMKLEAVLKAINTQRQDNYNVFLPFYPFTIDKLNLDMNELDSVIDKASVAVQIHDPRGRWIDDSYLLVGKAYYYKGDMENATKTFQYINAAFAPKEKKEYNTVVGKSEDDRLSIATEEKHKTWFSRFRHKAARNDAFLWQARTFLEQKKHDEAQSLLNILEGDPNFPARLDGQLAELQAYRFYKQGMYAETIDPLREAIRKSRGNRDQKARMSFILGQLYASQNKLDSAIAAFRDVIAFKPDALMDFNARVQIARANVKASGGGLDQSLAALQKMLRRERFIPFRDAIYYNMAVISANERPDQALEYLHKALKVENPNMLQKTLTFKGIADIHYFRKEYLTAQQYYDSTAAIMGPEFEDAEIVNTRKEVLTEVAAKIALIRQEDSLQRIAALPPAERDSLLSRQAEALRIAKTMPEEKGKKGESSRYQPFSNNNNDPLAANRREEESGGQWYFYNAASKSTGFSEFRRRWGNRQLTDNWRRSQGAPIGQINDQPAPTEEAPVEDVAAAIERLPADSINTAVLAENLPLTPEKLAESRNKQMDAWFDLGKLYNDKLETTRDAISAYDTLLDRFPQNPRKAEVIYSLYVWHDKLNHTQQAARYKQIMLTQFAGTNYASILEHGALKDESAERKNAVSTLYDSAYIAYLTGRYDTVFTLKHQADSAFGYTSLQPRFDLLEAMTIIKTRSDEEGKAAIEAVIKKYPGEEAILAQATAIRDVLNNKQQIVDYLGNLEITKENTYVAKVDENVSIRYPWQRQQQQLPDSAAVAVNKPATDSAATAVNAPATDSANVAAAPPPPPPPPPTPYKLGDEKAAIPHFVVMYFNRVSKVLLDEAVAQFSKYNAEKHTADKVETSSFALTPTEIMVIFRLFPTEEKALNYFDEIVKAAPSAIVPRIKPTEYKFFIISRDNFILLNNTKDISGYRKFFDNNYITE